MLLLVKDELCMFSLKLVAEWNDAVDDRFSRTSSVSFLTSTSLVCLVKEDVDFLLAVVFFFTSRFLSSSLFASGLLTWPVWLSLASLFSFQQQLVPMIQLSLVEKDGSGVA